MPDRACTLGDLAELVRSKNAGPFWLTLDVFFATTPDYRRAETAGVITPDRIGALYRVDPAEVTVFHLPDIRVIKASFPRPATQGSLVDRDLHGGQQYIPLAQLQLPACA